MASTRRTQVSTPQNSSSGNSSLKTSIVEVSSPEVCSTRPIIPNVVLYFFNFPDTEWNPPMVRQVIQSFDEDADLCVLYEGYVRRNGEWCLHCDVFVGEVERIESV